MNKFGLNGKLNPGSETGLKVRTKYGVYILKPEKKKKLRGERRNAKTFLSTTLMRTCNTKLRGIRSSMDLLIG